MKLSISKKFAKRSIKCLALFAPLAYLFGSLFFGLNGAHGVFPFAEPVYTQEYVESSFTVDVTQFAVFDDYKVDWLSNWFGGNSPSNSLSGLWNGFSGALTYGAWSSTSKNLYWRSSSGSYSLLGSYDNGVVTVSNTSSWVFNGTNDFVSFTSKLLPSLTYYRLVDVPSDVVPENNGANSDYLFMQFFAKDNFLVQWGENCISDNPVGFAPFGSFFKFLDDNMLHLSDSQIGLMGYGYIYYCLHVLIAFLAFDCVAFIPQLIMKVVHQFNKGVDSDD